MNNIKNNWKGIKSMIAIIKIFSDIPKSLSSNGSTSIDQLEISNVFNKYFATVAEKTKENINSSHFIISLIWSKQISKLLFLSLPINRSTLISKRNIFA